MILSVQTININCIIHYTPDPHIVFREWDKHKSLPSETDDTSDEFRVSGLGKFTHGDFNLTHQHWVQQIVNSGSFTLADTQAAEAFHKHCMRLPSERVRHLGARRTQQAMLRYLMKNLVFAELKDLVLPTGEGRPPPTPHPGVRLPLQFVHRGRVCNVAMGRSLTAVVTQRSMLHEEVRLARVELLDLMCAKFDMPRTQYSYAIFECVDWTFGQKLILPGGKQLWATDSAYSWYSDENSRNRRDCFILEGTEPAVATLSNGRQVRLRTALCCQAICFVKITNMDRLRRHVHVPYDIESEIRGADLI